VASRPATEYVAKLVGLNLYAGHVDGAEVRLRDGGTFVVPDHGQHGEVLVALRPSAVVVSTERAHTSARNTWRATIVGLTLLTDRVRIDLDGAPPALVDVTPAAVSELRLRSGQDVWLTAKATDLEVYSYAHPTRHPAAASPVHAGDGDHSHEGSDRGGNMGRLVEPGDR
jgi:molybdate transport system ATP-binding protein